MLVCYMNNTCRYEEKEAEQVSKKLDLLSQAKLDEQKLKEKEENDLKTEKVADVEANDNKSDKGQGTCVQNNTLFLFNLYTKLYPNFPTKHKFLYSGTGEGGGGGAQTTDKVIKKKSLILHNTRKRKITPKWVYRHLVVSGFAPGTKSHKLLNYNFTFHYTDNCSDSSE